MLMPCARSRVRLGRLRLLRTVVAQSGRLVERAIVLGPQQAGRGRTERRGGSEFILGRRELPAPKPDPHLARRCVCRLCRMSLILHHGNIA